MKKQISRKDFIKYLAAAGAALSEVNSSYGNETKLDLILRFFVDKIQGDQLSGDYHENLQNNLFITVLRGVKDFWEDIGIQIYSSLA